MKKFPAFLLILLINICSYAQPVCKDAVRANREKLYRNIVNNTITKNLSVSLSDSTEEQWQDAFWAMELIHFHSPWVDSKIRDGITGIQNQTIAFQYAILELAFCNYPQQFDKEIWDLFIKTTDSKILSICAIYLSGSSQLNDRRELLVNKIRQQYEKAPADPFLFQLYHRFVVADSSTVPPVAAFLQQDYLPGNVLLFSFQRKDRNYPGLALVRDRSGKFMKDDAGDLFSVPQLARSVANLPGFLTNGNTPEGISRMDGIDHSQSSFIGPTANIQLTMPFEYKAAHFFKDSTLTDSSWNLEQYKSLLPAAARDHIALLESWYAGKAGRTAIIAHGTTIDPAWYKGTPYFPLTPTQGCLCTKETWSDTTGLLMESDQQKLVNVILAAGGANGYCIVINIDDQHKPVTLADILPLLEAAGQK